MQTNKMLILLIFVAFVLLLIYLINKFMYLWKFKQLKISQPDKCYPIVGHALHFIGLSAQEKFAKMIELASCGDVMGKFWFGPVPVLVVGLPEDLQKIFSLEHVMEKAPFFYDTFGIDESVMVTKQKNWKSMRKVFNHSFSLSMLQSFIPIFVENSDRLTTSLAQYLDGRPFDLLMHISKATLDMFIKSHYGIEEPEESKDLLYEKIIDAVNLINTAISNRFVNFWIRPTIFYKLTELYKKDMEAREFAFGYQEMLYQKRKAIVIKEQKLLSEGEKPKSKKIVDELIFHEHLFPKSTITDNVNQMLLAGFETTANQLSHVILMVALHPEVQEKTYQEVKEIFHSDDVEFNLETLSELKYTEQVIKETMRLFPIIQFLAKTPSSDFELDGHVIPKGVMIFIFVSMTHRSPLLWGPNADKFDPENFSVENNEKRHPFSFLPFSMGKRNCLGYKYAMLSMKVMLAKMLLKYKLSTNLKFDKLKFLPTISLKLCTPYGIKLTER